MELVLTDELAETITYEVKSKGAGPVVHRPVKRLPAADLEASPDWKIRSRTGQSPWPPTSSPTRIR
jgi:hypothetical protein